MFFRLLPAEVATLVGFFHELPATSYNPAVADIYQRLLEENVPCVECGVPINAGIAIEELGFCVSCSNDYFDSTEDK